jgi:hypothetical protein
LVYTCGLDADYVLDRMQIYEVKPFIENSFKRHRDSWEQARIISYVEAQINSQKTISPKDIIEFTWDKNEEKRNISNSYTDEEKKRLHEEAIVISKQLK